MKKRLLVIALLLALLGLPTVALASDISGARYYGLIPVSNNSTATTNVATTCNISTQNLIDGNYLNASANNCVIRTSGGADIPFMPAVNATYPWCIWVPSIGADSYQNDILYTANSTGGEIKYFPDSGGMTTTDSASLEPGDNFTIEQSGWWDTSYSANKTALHKLGAFRIWISGSGNISAGQSLDEDWVSPTGDLGTGSWTSQSNAYDDNTTIYAQELNVGAGSWSTFIELTRAATTITGLRYWVDCHTDFNSVDVDVYYSGAYHDVYEGSFTHGQWEEEEFSAADVTQLRLRLYNSGGTTRNARLYEVDFGVDFPTVTASGISSGEYTVRVSANLTSLGIWIDDELKDSTALTANVTDNSANWTYYENTGGYWEYTKIWVDGVLQQHIEWEYDTTFTDQSGNNHDATPTFRTTTSNADVSAELISFQPIAEAQAPDYALGTAPAFIDPDITGNMTGTFTTTPGAGTFPLAGVITAVANATSTPPQLPLLIIAVFIILAASLTASALMRHYGSGSLIAKIEVITAFMGIFIALGNFAIDFWMLVVFLIIAVSIAFMSKQIGWT